MKVGKSSLVLLISFCREKSWIQIFGGQRAVALFLNPIELSGENTIYRFDVGKGRARRSA
jgi:hypothetical protein